MSDDHAAHAISAYGSRINETPQHRPHRRRRACASTTASAPTRSARPAGPAILTGTYSHVNGVLTLDDDLDGRQETFPKLLQAAGYQTAHVRQVAPRAWATHDPTGFDHWAILPGQGLYHNPVLGPMGELDRPRRLRHRPDHRLRIDWLTQRDRSGRSCLMCHHKAPHRPWEPDAEARHDVRGRGHPRARHLRRRLRRPRPTPRAARTMRIDRT